MDTENSSVELQHHAYHGPERRRLLKRRIRPDQRSCIRFDAMGGDRRLGYARRSTDEGLRSNSIE